MDGLSTLLGMNYCPSMKFPGGLQGLQPAKQGALDWLADKQTQRERMESFLHTLYSVTRPYEGCLKSFWLHWVTLNINKICCHNLIRSFVYMLTDIDNVLIKSKLTWSIGKASVEESCDVFFRCMTTRSAHHISGAAMSAAAECGCELLPHPPCLLDLAPSDFCLFPLLK